jgi:hypothetical protein
VRPCSFGLPEWTWRTRLACGSNPVGHAYFRAADEIEPNNALELADEANALPIGSVAGALCNGANRLGSRRAFALEGSGNPHAGEKHGRGDSIAAKVDEAGGRESCRL